MSEQLRPKDMTLEQIVALPIGPFVEHSRGVTLDDMLTGVAGKEIVTYTAAPTMATYVEPDDVVAVMIDGRLYGFGQFRDGSWYRVPYGVFACQ